jgi:hypothetical protein
MKSEERKENQTNALRVWLEGTAERLKGRTAYALGGSIVLVVAVVGLYLYWLSGQKNEKAQRFVNLYNADSVEKLDQITKAGPPDSNVAAFARLQKARLALFRDGIEKLGNLDSDEFRAAVVHIEEGRKLYKDIVNDLKTEPALLQEAWISCAKAEESLLGVPKSKESTEYLGSYDDMLKDYDNAAAINPGSEVSKGYAATAAKLRDDKEKIVAFYTRLNQLRTVAPFKTSP